MGGFHVTTAELLSAQAFVTDLAGDVRVDLGKVSKEVDRLLADGWSGTAANGFKGGWTEWHAGTLEVLDALGRMGTLLAATAKYYNGHDVYTGAGLNMAGGDL